MLDGRRRHPAHPAARRTQRALDAAAPPGARRSASPGRDALSYPEFIRGLDPARAGARGAHAGGDGRRPRRRLHARSTARRRPTTEHFAIARRYAHATAPLRRLQDRYVSECCLAACAGTPPPDWVRAGLAALPAAMAAGAAAPGASSAGSSTSSRPSCSQGREGERFDAVVIDDGLVQLRDPAVRGRIDEDAPEPGSEVTVRLLRADPATRTVAFAVA